MDETKNPWKILSEKPVYDNPWIKVTEFDVLHPGGGSKGIYGKIHFKNYAIGIVALDHEQNIYLVGQYRFPLNEYSWEIPEGGGPMDIDPLDSAKRELLEETGITAKTWKIIQKIHLSNSVSDECGLIYLATDLSYGIAEPEETEDLQIKKICFKDAYQLVCDGTITDSLSVAGIFKVNLLMVEGSLTV